MPKALRVTLWSAITAAAMVASLWYYGSSDLAFANGKQLLAAKQADVAEILFRVDRTAARARFVTDALRLGLFLRQRADDLPAFELGHAASDRYREEAIGAFESFTSRDELAQAEALSWAALTLRELHPFDPVRRAEPLLRRAIAIRDQRLGADHADTMPLVFSLSELLLRRWRFEQDQGLLKEARALTDRLLANARKRQANDPTGLELCGDIAAAQSRWQDAEQCYRSAIVAYRDEPLDFSGIVAEKLSDLLRAQGRTAEADEVMKATFKFGGAKF